MLEYMLGYVRICYDMTEHQSKPAHGALEHQSIPCWAAARSSTANASCGVMPLSDPAEACFKHLDLEIPLQCLGRFWHRGFLELHKNGHAPKLLLNQRSEPHCSNRSSLMLAVTTGHIIFPRTAFFAKTTISMCFLATKSIFMDLAPMGGTQGYKSRTLCPDLSWTAQICCSP